MTSTAFRTKARFTWEFRQFRVATLVLLVGWGATLLASSPLRERDREAARLRFAEHVADASGLVFNAFLVPLEVALSVPAFVEAQDELTAAAFARFATPAVQRHGGITALEWAPRVVFEDKAAFEAAWGRAIVEPAPDGALRPVPDRAEYFPIHYMVPDFSPLLGLDLAFEPGRRAMIARAWKGSPVCSEAFQLVEDPAGVMSVAVFAPANDPMGVRRGLAIALFRLRPVVMDALARTDLAGLGFSLIDDSAPAGQQLLAAQNAELGRAPDSLHWQRAHRFLDRSWRLEWYGDPQVFEGEHSAPTALVLGGLLSLLAAGAVAAIHIFARLRRQIADAQKLGNYTLLELLGQGGMGAVYKARHALLRRPTAIKLIKPESAGPVSEQRFEREVQYTSELTHPNTIRIFDYGRTRDGIFYYVMEYLEGITLEALIRATGPLPPGRAVFLLEQIAGSLSEAHRAGVIHRDLKPENIMVCDMGGIGDFVKVLDFGLVKPLRAAGEEGLSQGTGLVGTPSYMSPEAMIDPNLVTPAADVYALGGILYTMLTGSPVFSGKNLLALMTQALSVAPEPLEQRLGSPLPQQLSELALRCLAKKPEQRPADATELLRELRALRGLGDWLAQDARAWWDEVGTTLSAELRARERGPLSSDETLVVGDQERHLQRTL